METNDKNRKMTSEENEIPASLNYPASEDIYAQGQKEADIDPEDPTKKKTFDAPNSLSVDEAAFEKDISGSDLDIPGAELDDTLENTGDEDEENNFYSIGGDNHNDLEETNDDIL